MSTIILGFEKLNRKFARIQSEIQNLPKYVEEVANRACQEAQQILDSGTIETIPQSHRYELSSYLTVVQSQGTENAFYITAGEGANLKIKYELYFTEYGAGLMYYEPPNIGAITYPAYPKGSGGKPFWFWWDETTQDYIYCTGAIGLHYLRSAREVARVELHGISGKIKTAIRGN